MVSSKELTNIHTRITMADFIIPQGEEFKFTMKVITNDSFLPQSVADLVDIGVAESATKVKLQNRDTLACLVSTGVTIEKIPDDVVVPITVVPSARRYS